jgi:hypothetical protein
MIAKRITVLLLTFAGLGCKLHFQLGGVGNRPGSGIVAVETVSVMPFQRIVAGGATEVIVREESTTSVEFEIDDNLVDLVAIESSGDTLMIRTTSGYNSTNGLKVRVSTPKLQSIHLSGASRGTVDGVHGDDFAIELSGASSVTVKGTAKKLNAQASGASRVHCFELETERATVSLSGASNGEVHATQSLKVNASGASNVTYVGKPEHIEKSVSGASSVRTRD